MSAIRVPRSRQEHQHCGVGFVECARITYRMHLVEGQYSVLHEYHKKSFSKLRTARLPHPTKAKQKIAVDCVTSDFVFYAKSGTSSCVLKALTVYFSNEYIASHWNGQHPGVSNGFLAFEDFASRSVHISDQGDHYRLTPL